VSRDYRYVAVRGLEYREICSRYWYRVTPEMLAQMTPAELRRVADVMDAALSTPTQEAP
jgi:hypothetical protein